MRALIALLALVLVACGNHAEPAAPVASASPPASVSSAPPSAPSAPAPEPSAEPAPAKRQRPLEVRSSCASVVTLLFGDDPKTAGRRTLSEGATLDGPRDESGNMTVWLLDAHGEPTTHVKVTRGIKKVEVGRSCATLDAR